MAMPAPPHPCTPPLVPVGVCPAPVYGDGADVCHLLAAPREGQPLDCAWRLPVRTPHERQLMREHTCAAARAAQRPLALQLSLLHATAGLTSVQHPTATRASFQHHLRGNHVHAFGGAALLWRNQRPHWSHSRMAHRDRWPGELAPPASLGFPRSRNRPRACQPAWRACGRAPPSPHSCSC